MFSEISGLSSALSSKNETNIFGAHSENNDATDILGEKIDLRTGSVIFQHADVVLPGNFDIDVAIRRKFETERASNRVINGVFASWDLLIPKVTTKVVEVEALDESTFSDDFQGSWYNGKECSEALELGDVPLKIKRK